MTASKREEMGMSKAKKTVKVPLVRRLRILADNGYSVTVIADRSYPRSTALQPYPPTEQVVYTYQLDYCAGVTRSTLGIYQTLEELAAAAESAMQKAPKSY